MKVFPRTPHLSWSGFRGRDDLSLSETESLEFLRNLTCVQEKLDGANVSFRVEQGRLVAENRGKPLSGHPQFDRLKSWVRQHEVRLRALESLVLFGEWLFAQHGTCYDRLPDWFIAYDLYDPEMACFLASDRVAAVCESLGVPVVSTTAWRRGDGSECLLALARERSSFSSIALREGLYCRREGDGRVLARAKLLRPGYQPRSDEDWKKRGLITNSIAVG